MKPFEFKSFSVEESKVYYSVVQQDEDYQTVTNEFLKKLLKEFARLSMKSFRPRIGAANFAYMYSERRLDSVVLPALSNICDGVVLTELPVIRKKSKRKVKSEHGRADYWCIYKGYTFVIEMKGSRDRLDCSTVRENSVIKRWGTMIEQLIDIRETCEKLDDNTKGVIRLGLHFLSSWSPADPTQDEIVEYRSLALSNLNAICNEIATKHGKPEYEPSFAALWQIPEKMVLYYEDVTYPGVMLVAKVFEPIVNED